ncbi:MAG: hypothetical protein SFT81_04730 [Candidatus Caenarcaniphilales bacterium]|nr:hypothetical protein [Candidatus Caenarcaniphilales bacterium]
MALGANTPNLNLPPAFQNRNVQIGILVGVILIIAAVILFFVYSANTSLGNFRLLVKAIDQSRALEIAAELKTFGIETEMVQAETGGVSIEVRDKQYDAAVLQLARSDLLSQDDFKLFDKTDYASSDYEKRVKYMRAVGGELSRLVSRMEGIKWGKVHVTIPQQKLFNGHNGHNDSSASVTVETDPGYVLNGSQVASILSLVSGYVPELIPQHISITDTKGRVYSSAAQIDEASPGGGALLGQSMLGSQTENTTNQIERRVQDYLDSVVGIGNSKVAVSLRLVSARLSKQSTTFYPGAIASHEYSEEALGDAAASAPYHGQIEVMPLDHPHAATSDEGDFKQSKGMEMVDPRLTKDLPPKPEGLLVPGVVAVPGVPLVAVPGIAVPALPVPGIPVAPGVPTPQPVAPSREDELKDSYYKNGMPEKMAQQMEMMQKMQELNQNQKMNQQNYVCAADDTACQRNYRQHNFAIQNYPSFEQVHIDSPPGDIRMIKISVVLAKGTLPTSISRLKRAIAAAADPGMSPENVEIVLRKVEEEPPKQDSFTQISQILNFEKSPWLGICLVVLGVILLLFIVSKVFSAAASIGRNMRFKPYEPNANPYGSQQGNEPPSNQVTDRLNDYPLRRNTTQSPPPQSTRPPEPTYAEPKQPLTSGLEESSFDDLPFELDDEFDVPQTPAAFTPPQTQTQAPPPRAKIFFDEDEG